MRVLPFLALLAAAPALAQNAPLQLQPPKPAAAPASARPAAPAKPPAAIGALSALSDREAVDRANAFFNASPIMSADFVQVAGDGRRSEGTLLVQKPGRMRFSYAKPATLEIVADGTTVAVKDRKLATQDLYLIGQTPLKFLLREKIDLSRDTRVLDVEKSANAVSILIEDKATIGGTARIKLVFDPTSFQIKQWTVTDAQGFDTIVTLFNLDLVSKPDPAQFKIEQQRAVGGN